VPQGIVDPVPRRIQRRSDTGEIGEGGERIHARYVSTTLAAVCRRN
jgi:hypothetical protein